MNRLLLLAATVLVAGGLGYSQDENENRRDWTLSADVVYTAAGDKIENGAVRVDSGKISGVGPGAGGDIHVAAITPGLIDLSLRLGGGLESVEQTQEVTPGIHVDAAVDLYDEAWLAQAKTGVTAGFVAPLDRNVIGGYGSLYKTAGAPSYAARVVAADAALRGSMGTEPSRGNRSFATPLLNGFYQRRPTTRMGVEWAWRKACYDAAYSREDESYAFPGSADLVRALDGEVPLFIQAWASQDIRTTVFLKEEIEREGLGHPRVIIDSAAEAWHEPKLVSRSGVSIVLPPLPPDGRTGDGALMTLTVAKELTDLGVPVALSSHGWSGVGQSLAHQAGWAMRGGLSFEEALATVTINPARMVGASDRVGSIEVGKDADLVLWNGKPFELTSRVVGVLVDGKLVLDPRGEEGASE